MIGICHECGRQVDTETAVQVAPNIFECICDYPNSLGDLGLQETEVTEGSS